MNNRIAIFPGSFDPFTRGHKAVVDQALQLFDRVIIAIGHNISKRNLLSIEARKALIAKCYEQDSRVEVAVYEGLTCDYAIQRGCCAMIRGVRNSADFEYERLIEATNRRLYPTLTTVILCTPPSMIDISSSIVRELHHYGRDVSEFMVEGIDINEFIEEPEAFQLK